MMFRNETLYFLISESSAMTSSMNSPLCVPSSIIYAMFSDVYGDKEFHWTLSFNVRLPREGLWREQERNDFWYSLALSYSDLCSWNLFYTQQFKCKEDENRQQMIRSLFFVLLFVSAEIAINKCLERRFMDNYKNLTKVFSCFVFFSLSNATWPSHISMYRVKLTASWFLNSLCISTNVTIEHIDSTSIFHL